MSPVVLQGRSSAGGILRFLKQDNRRRQAYGMARRTVYKQASKQARNAGSSKRSLTR